MKFMKILWKWVKTTLTLSLYFGAIALVLGFIVGFSYKVFQLTYHLWI